MVIVSNISSGNGNYHGFVGQDGRFNLEAQESQRFQEPEVSAVKRPGSECTNKVCLIKVSSEYLQSLRG